MTESIQSIEKRLKSIQRIDGPMLGSLRNDPHKGVQQALALFERRLKKEAPIKGKYGEMFCFGGQGYAQGHQRATGINEIGRGPLAGSIVAATIILPKNEIVLGLNDSKQLSEKKRELPYRQVKEEALAIGIRVVDQQTVDDVNIYEASKSAVIQAVEKSSIIPSYLLIDAMVLDLPIQQEKVIKGDIRSVSTAAASVIAKVYRSQLVKEYGVPYPGYGFSYDAGYGTKEYLEGFERQGITPVHRKSFASVKKYLQ